MVAQFRDRSHAGRLLAERLTAYAGAAGVLVLALPRGGVPVAHEIAQALGAPWDVFIVRKLGVPGYEELAMGAVASGGVRVLNRDIVEGLDISSDAIEQVAATELQEVERRERAYRGPRPAPEVRDRTVILVDDGLATGACMRAAIAALRRQHPARLVVAVPVGGSAACAEIRTEVEELVCLMTPVWFNGIGAYYRDFAQLTDDEVRALLQSAGASVPPRVLDMPVNH